MYIFKILCPKCNAGIMFESEHNWFHGAKINCPKCPHVWIEDELIGEIKLCSEVEKQNLYERGRRIFDDIVIPD